MYRRDLLSGFLASACLLALSIALASCSSPNESAAPSRQLATTIIRPATPSATRSASPVPANTPTPIPTLAPIAVPTAPADGVILALAPQQEQTGWVGNAANGVFTPDNDLNVGILKGQAFTSIIQFDLTNLAPGTKVLYAALELSGRNGNSLGSGGQWNIDLLDTETSNWENATYDAVHGIPALFPIGTPLSPGDLVAGARKRFIFSADQLGQLQKQVDLGSISIRLNGPDQGNDNLFVWDATPGDREPTLYLVVVPAAFTVVTGTPTPPDIFAAATRVVAQTLQAHLFGTPTPLPRSMATETPLPYVVYTEAPTAVNLAEAEATSSYATAVAVTTGTPTPFPLNWITATPPPVSIPFGLLTPVPTSTPTLAPLASPELAKRPLDGSLYNKIAFLSGDRTSPTAWIVDPDGSHLAELSDRTYYDIAAARDTVSSDGAWFLYNALDGNGILQIWRSNLVSSDVPPQQMTFFTRGFSYAAVWSPDGTRIALTSTKDGREQEIFMYDFNNPKKWPRLTFSQDSYLWDQYPSYSPDGKQIAFSTDRGHIAAYTEIWVMNADGSGAKKIGDGSRDAWAPVWIKWTQ